MRMNYQVELTVADYPEARQYLLSVEASHPKVAIGKACAYWRDLWPNTLPDTESRITVGKFDLVRRCDARPAFTLLQPFPFVAESQARLMSKCRANSNY
jgi:hypothetical protein